MRTLPSGNLKNFCADVYPHLCVRALKTKSYINNRKLFHAEQVLSRITFNSTLRSRLTLKSKIAFTRTWKDILTVNHESRINKSLNHVSREKNSPNHASRQISARSKKMEAFSNPIKNDTILYPIEAPLWKLSFRKEEKVKEMLMVMTMKWTVY